MSHKEIIGEFLSDVDVGKGFVIASEFSPECGTTRRHIYSQRRSLWQEFDLTSLWEFISQALQGSCLLGFLGNVRQPRQIKPPETYRPH